MEDEKLCRELKNISYLKPCRRLTTVKNRKITKSFEGTTCGGEEINEKSKNSEVVEKSEQFDEDLDLHASKSHILNLIDKALSKEFGPLEGKKVFEITRENEMFLFFFYETWMGSFILHFLIIFSLN